MAEQKVKLTQLPEATDTTDTAVLLVNQNETDQRLPITHLLRAKNNLSELENAAQARANLGVPSVEDVNDKIEYLIDGKSTFLNGATLESERDFIWDDNSKSWYYWTGAFSKEVPAASTPESTGGIGVGKWLSVGDASLRSELAQPDGSSMIGNGIGTVSDALTYITPEQFAEQYPGETNWAVMINKAYEYARENGKTVLLANVYHIRTSIIHYDGVRVINSGKIICDPAGDYSVNTPSGPENAAYLITTKNGMYNQIKGMYLNSLYIAHTEDVETTGYTAPAINAKGVVISDIASITIGSIKTFGFLLGGVDVGGTAGKGYEIRILDATSWIYQWTDSNIAGFVVNVQDSTFNDIAPTGYGVGIDMKQGMNVYVNPHPWGYPLTGNNMYPNRQMKIGFRIRSGGNTLIRPYADTISRVTASSVNNLTNGGIAFYIENWRNVITATAVMAHSEDISTGMAICYMSDAKLNIFELSTVVNTGKFIAEKVMYVSPETLFTNSFTGNFWAGANDMSGDSKLNGTGLTSSGTYRLIRSNGMVSISFILSISAVSSPSGPLTLPLPRGLTLYYGGNNSASVRTCFTMPSDVVDVLAISNGSNIEFYFVGSNGSRTKATASSVKTGLLEVVVFGMLSN
ncbi:hypothetical protein [Hafnia alvei]|uniref:Tail spike TSP1/Gp66 N-terminal domain-containing protein n=1 Tax=Hafnia alvei ATCC 51873 TaxID=1002364 RepID=G9YA88_HAFAL|nr:hypothetical protein [Hafnia alvei]EHM40218.1 hypothetical protein HMPREF0454_03509 [Hafnia alvei ATCC 51873]QQE45351.1 hypothetical protein I6H95_08730 [Hafnia alvei]